MVENGRRKKPGRTARTALATGCMLLIMRRCYSVNIVLWQRCSTIKSEIEKQERAHTCETCKADSMKNVVSRPFLLAFPQMSDLNAASSHRATTPFICFITLCLAPYLDTRRIPPTSCRLLLMSLSSQPLSKAESGNIVWSM